MKLVFALVLICGVVSCTDTADIVPAEQKPVSPDTKAQNGTSAAVIKVLHYNVCGNMCWEEEDYPGSPESRGSMSRMSRILSAIDNYQPHAITFNEICYSQYRHIRADLIDRGYGATYSSTTQGYSCDNFDATYGTGYGNAIFFKGTTPLATQYPLPQGTGLEPRELLCTEVNFDGRLIKLCTTHITNNTTWKDDQIAAVADLASGWIGAGQPVIITGDFNAEPDDAVMDPMYSHSGGTGEFQEADESHSCPAPLTYCRGGETTFGQVRDFYFGPYPQTKLDYIFFSAAAFGGPFGDAKSAFPEPISDHNMLQGSATLQ